jgi:RNA polymerase sigma factor (sigma-70 family)
MSAPQRATHPPPAAADDVADDAADDAAAIAQSLHLPERFALLFDRHAPYIHRYVARRLGAHAADDLVAETFLTAFRKRERYDRSRPDARPWLYGIATNLIGAHRRAEVRELRLRARSAVEAEPFPEERVVARVSAQARRPQLAAALADLPPPERDVLLLVGWEQLSYEEVAHALDIPIGTVRSRLHRARRALRAALPDLAGGEPR